MYGWWWRMWRMQKEILGVCIMGDRGKLYHKHCHMKRMLKVGDKVRFRRVDTGKIQEAILSKKSGKRHWRIDIGTTSPLVRWLVVHTELWNSKNNILLFDECPYCKIVITREDDRIKITREEIGILLLVSYGMKIVMLQSK